MRAVNKPIEVEISATHQPQIFHYHGTHQVKRVLDFWLEVGEWWSEDQETSYFRVNTTEEGIYELCYRHKEKSWYLTKVFD